MIAPNQKWLSSARLPHIAGIPGAVSVEWVFLLGHLIQCQAKFAAFLQLGAVLWVVGTVELDVDGFARGF